MKENTLKNKNVDPDIFAFDDDDLLISDDEENLSNDIEIEIVEKEKARQNVIKPEDYNEFADFDHFKDFMQLNIIGLNETEEEFMKRTQPKEGMGTIQVDLNKINDKPKNIIPESLFKEDGMMEVNSESIDKYFGENDDVLLSEHTKQMEQLRGKNKFGGFGSSRITGSTVNNDYLSNLAPKEPINLNLNKQEMAEVERMVNLNKPDMPVRQKMFGLNLHKEDYVDDFGLDLRKKPMQEEPQNFIGMLINPGEHVDDTQSKMSSKEINNLVGDEDFAPAGYDANAEIDRELQAFENAKNKKKKGKQKPPKPPKPPKPKKEKKPKPPKKKKEKPPKKEKVKKQKKVKGQPVPPVMDPNFIGPPPPPVKKEKPKKEKPPKKEKVKKEKVKKEKPPKKEKVKKEKKPLTKMDVLNILLGAHLLVQILNVLVQFLN